jgi:AraC-like DNA-binding protein
MAADLTMVEDEQQGAYTSEIAMSLNDPPSRSRSVYREFPAPAELASLFLCFWTQTIIGSRDAYEHRVLPDACIDIVLINDEPPIVVGPWTVSFVARLAVGTSIMGARVHPGRASCLLGMPASELLNQTIPIAAVGGAMQNMQLAKVIEQPNAAARRRALAQALFAALEHSTPFDPAVLAGIQWLACHPHGRVGKLSRWIGISERQLHRRFSAAIGYGPKMFQSVLRFQRLLKTAREMGSEQSFADLAARAGYADQPHMTRDVHRLASVRPTVLLRSAESTLQMSDLFKTMIAPRIYLRHQ